MKRKALHFVCALLFFITIGAYGQTSTQMICQTSATTNVINVQYKINEGSSAYLSINGTYMSNVSNNYILAIDDEQITIDVSNYPLGTYIVTLVIDGNISDSENLIIH